MSTVALASGLRSDDAYLRNTMLKLACPAEAFAQYSAKELSYEQALRQLNRYTTTLHGINSAIIKLGKLTKATKVPRAKCCPGPPLFACCRL